MIRRALCALAMIAGASPVAAQGAIQFFPRYDFHLSAEHLSKDDPRFVWDTNFGGDMDFVDYGFGRTRFGANYEAILGEEFRRFDPNQGNYLLDLSTSARTHGYEIAALLQGRPEPPQDALRLAAWTSVARVFLNLDETITRE